MRVIEIDYLTQVLPINDLPYPGNLLGTEMIQAPPWFVSLKFELVGWSTRIFLPATPPLTSRVALLTRSIKLSQYLYHSNSKSNYYESP